MSLYCTPDKKIIFLINLKCGYSTFWNLKTLGIIEDYWYERETFEKAKIYMIVREPIKRFVSFFKDKFITQKHDFSQICQNEMLKYYSYDEIMSNDFNITKCLNAINRGYENEHLQEQYVLYETYDNINDIELLLMDDKLNDKLCNIFSISEIEIKNKSISSAKIDISENDKTKLKKLYERDYKLLEKLI